jgi:glycosyltransferase involved in cell wall biosynthesis
LLSPFPSPPNSINGWPWTEESKPLPPLKPDGNPWPRISIVTPSFNQGLFIEETIRSVILQNYPSLEYIIIDGGSSDNSLEIIKKYEHWITYWTSEPDNGQSHAINKGFSRCTGQMVNWICSDDMLCKDALFNIAPVISNNMNSLILGNGLRIDQKSVILNKVSASAIKKFSELMDIKKFWRKSDSIMQQSAFYPLNEIRNIGYLNESNHYSMDYELWGRLLINEITVLQSNFYIGIFRWYAGQKTSNFNVVTKSLLQTAYSLVLCNSKISTLKKYILLYKVFTYDILNRYQNLRSYIAIKRRLKSLFNVRFGNLHQ